MLWPQASFYYQTLISSSEVYHSHSSPLDNVNSLRKRRICLLCTLSISCSWITPFRTSPVHHITDIKQSDMPIMTSGKLCHYLPTTACGLETGHTVDCASWSWLTYLETKSCRWGLCAPLEAWQVGLLPSLLLCSAYTLDQGTPDNNICIYSTSLSTHFYP